VRAALEWRPVVTVRRSAPRGSYTSKAIESLDARFRKAVRHRGHFPNEQAAL